MVRLRAGSAKRQMGELKFQLEVKLRKGPSTGKGYLSVPRNVNTTAFLGINILGFRTPELLI